VSAQTGDAQSFAVTGVNMSERALDRLRRAVEYIEGHPGQFDMDTFVDWRESCGTTACLAGWLVLLEDGEEAVDHLGDTVTLTAKAVPIEERAAQLLELDPNKFRTYSAITWRLFYAENMPANQLRGHVERTLGVTL